MTLAFSGILNTMDDIQLKQHMATKLLVFFILSSKDFMLYTSSLNTESGTRIVSSSGILYSVDDAGVILFLIF